MTLYMTLFEKVYKVQFIEFLLQHDYNRIWNISLNCPVENSSPSTAVFSAAKNFSRPHNLSHSIVVIEKTWRELCFHVCSWLCRENPFQVNDSICILKLNKDPRETEVHVDPGTLALCCNSYPLCVQLNLIAICSSGILRSIPTQVAYAVVNANNAWQTMQTMRYSSINLVPDNFGFVFWELCVHKL